MERKLWIVEKQVEEPMYARRNLSVNPIIKKWIPCGGCWYANRGEANLFINEMREQGPQGKFQAVTYRRAR